MTDRLLSVAPSPAFWVAVAMYGAAAAALLVVLAGASKARPLALGLVAIAFVAHGIDIGWRGTEQVHPAQSVREAMGFLAWILTGGYLLASARYQLTLGAVVVMPVALIILVAARLTPAGPPRRRGSARSAGSTSRSRRSASAGSRGAQVRYKLTSLTTITFLADGVTERYTQAVDRDNDGFRILPGVEFGPLALLKGKAQIGYRTLDTKTEGMPDFSGLVANVELSYVLLGSTRFTVGVSRDIYFSYEIDEPFYVQPGFTLTVTQQLAGPWDVQARGGWTGSTISATVTGRLDLTAPGRVDRYQTYGGGVGYRVGKDIRVGFNLDYVRRESIVAASR